MESDTNADCSGGLGLTGGIADVDALSQCLLTIHNGLIGDECLDKYSESRIMKWKEIIDPASRANFRRIWDDSPEILEEKGAFLESCKAIVRPKRPDRLIEM